MSESRLARGLLAASLFLLLSCGQSEAPSPPPESDAAATATPTAEATIPITTDSLVAREAFEQGRHLLERVRIADAHEYFSKSVADDPGFALGWWGVAATAPSASEFFEASARAMELADGVSEGERLLILAQDAAARGDAEAQLGFLRQLVADYPKDARSHNALAQLHAGRQEFAQAIEHFGHAVELDPDNPAPYNSLGYAYRAAGDFAAAEQAFLKNIELIGNEPNPYDSYAELLMKMGRYQESIEQYRKALDIDPRFVASRIGIGVNRIFLGESAAARDSFQELLNRARNDGERRQGRFWMAMSHVYDGDHEEALTELEKMYAIAEANEDLPGMAADLNTMGTVALDAGQPDRALGYFRQAEATMERAPVSFDVKEGARRNLTYFAARAAIARGDRDEARSLAAQYQDAVAAKSIPFEERRVAELNGTIALTDGDYATALDELAGADQQNPRILYLQALAHAGTGDREAAQRLARQVAEFNELNPQLAFVRSDAREMAGGGPPAAPSIGG